MPEFKKVGQNQIREGVPIAFELKLEKRDGYEIMRFSVPFLNLFSSVVEQDFNGA